MCFFPNHSFLETSRLDSWCKSMKEKMSILKIGDTVSFQSNKKIVTGQIVEKINFYSVMITENGNKWGVGVDLIELKTK
jgi:hypothetical protein